MTMREAREAKGLTQVQVAIVVGVSLQAYRLWEAGAAKPNDKNKKKLEEVLRLK